MPNLTKHEIIDIHYDALCKYLSYAYSFYSGKYIIGRYVDGRYIDGAGDIFCFIKIPSRDFKLKTRKHRNNNPKEVYLDILGSAMSYCSDEVPPEGEAEIKACISLIDDLDNFINGDVVQKLEGYISKMNEEIGLIKSKYEQCIYDEIKKASVQQTRSKNAKFK